MILFHLAERRLKCTYLHGNDGSVGVFRSSLSFPDSTSKSGGSSLTTAAMELTRCPFGASSLTAALGIALKETLIAAVSARKGALSYPTTYVQEHEFSRDHKVDIIQNRRNCNLVEIMKAGKTADLSVCNKTRLFAQ